MENYLLPDQKQAKIEEIEKSLRVLYLGDGVNDLPALQSASLSGAPFANINMLTADVDFLFTDESMGLELQVIIPVMYCRFNDNVRINVNYLTAGRFVYRVRLQI